MRHPIDGFRIPAPIVRLFDYLASLEEAEYLESWELQLRFAPLLYDFSPDLLAARSWELPDLPRGKCQELDYLTTPFELSPVSWSGFDGLHYDWVVHAPELDLPDFPMVSYAPSEDAAVWLGDDTAQGLAHLMVGKRKARMKRRMEDPLQSPQWELLVGLVGHRPNPDDPRITPGARSRLACVPHVPEGYRFQAAHDGVGVLAPAHFFGELDVAALSRDELGLDREARTHASAGRHATALLALKQWRPLRPEDPGILERMRDAYEALGRPMHAARAAMALSRR
jgi:hypothetical protein